MEILSKRIKDLRTDADLKQLDLAAILGITQNMVSNYENGRDVPPEVIAGYSKHFNVSTDFLLGISSAPYPPNTNALKPFDLLYSAERTSFSMVKLCALLQTRNGVEVLVVLPRPGDGVALLQEAGVPYCTVRSFACRARCPGQRARYAKMMRLQASP